MGSGLYSNLNIVTFDLFTILTQPYGTLSYFLNI